MKIVLLTNFEDYEPQISCDKYGIISLKLIPNRLNDIRLKDNYILRKSKTLFHEKYCTIYKKSKNEYLYKYTNYMPRNNFSYEKVDILKHNIPYNYDLSFSGITLNSIKKSFYTNRFNYYRKKYNSF